ncbi:MAG TPA: hypothetical protein VJT71_06105 [Pyrinomonadaceae bacterium]|nr:hypothetical protein [Pyrinomonadaceae bacterium]
MNPESKSRVVYQNLDTSFVNLWGLLRFLSQRSFVGRVHVELADYTADVFLAGSNIPMVHEVDRAAGTDVTEEAALHRLVLRVRESPGSISVFEGEDEAIAPPAVTQGDAKDEELEAAEEETVPVIAEIASPDKPAAATPESMRSATKEEPPAQDTQSAPATENEWNDVVRVSGDLIGGIDRVATAAGTDFAALFRQVQIALADDYTFLDPMSGHFEYANSEVTMSNSVPVNSYVAGVTETLRRTVEQIATGERARRTRERVALELARVARKNDDALTRSGFKSQLDRIAGTKVI